MDTQKKTEAEINEALCELQSGWRNDGSSISKTFTFDSFTEATDFVAALGELSDDLDGHYPDEVLVRGQAVSLRLATHTVQGVSETDLDLAKLADDIVESALAYSVTSRFLDDDDDEGDDDADDDEG